MEYSTLAPWQEISETGVMHDLGNLYDRFHKIKDPRKAQGKSYSLVTLVVEKKENEIVAAPQALQQVCVEGKIITGDAMHAQRAVSADIVAQGTDYLWVVKENQERLYQDIERLLAADIPLPGCGKLTTDFQSAEKVNGGHGRIKKRSIQTSAVLNGYVDWPGSGQVYRLERTLTWMRRGQAIKITDGMSRSMKMLRV